LNILSLLGKESSSNALSQEKKKESSPNKKFTSQKATNNKIILHLLNSVILPWLNFNWM
jgi:hypothetical protein